MNRRQFVSGAGGAAIVGLAGCLRAVDAASGPGGVVQQYLEAVEAGDTETQRELVHPASEFERDLGPTDMTIHDIEQQPLEEIFERIDRYDNDAIDEHLAAEEEALSDLTGRVDFGMRAYVYVSVTADVFEYDEFCVRLGHTAREARAGAGRILPGDLSIRMDRHQGEWFIL